MAERPQMTTALNGGYANQFANMLKQPVKQSWLPTRAIHGGLGLLDAYNQWEAPDPTTLDGALEYGSMPAKAVVGLGKGMADVLKGAMDNPQDTGKVFDLASMVAGGGFGASKILGDVPAGSIGMFAGTKAKTANPKALNLAKRMESDGASRDEIWKATGDQFGQPWVNDAKGGGWKFEIDDSSSRIAPKGEVSFGQLENVGAYTPESRLGDNIWHQGLYDGYPKISEINTSLAKADYPSGSFHSTTMNEKPFRSEIKADGADLESIKSTLLHEGQHGVQEAEGFARGGSMKDLKNPSTTEWFQDRLDDGVFQIEQAVKYGDKSAEVYNPATGKNIVIEGKDYKEYVDYASQKGAAADLHYRHLAGEAEARNVQTRMDYPMQQRIDEAPWTTLDVPENELIFRGNGNNKSMINALQGKDRNP